MHYRIKNSYACTNSYQCGLMSSVSRLYSTIEASTTIISIYFYIHKFGCCDLRKIGFDGISAIAENCPLISELYLYSCKFVDDLYVIA